jgi:adenosine kinase
MRILFTGSIAYDYLMTFPGYFKDHILPERLETISLSFLVESMTRQRGGTAPNIAYTLALLGGRPSVMGTVGEDFGDYRAWLEAQGVDCSAVKLIPGTFTASFFANTDRANAQIASFYPGAMRKFVRECKELKLRYVYDPSQQLARMTNPAEVGEDVHGAWMLTVNDYEFGLIEKMTGWTETTAQQHVEVLVITRGDKGATIYAEGVRIDVSVVPAERIVDPTGVGDAFRGGLLRGVAAGWPWPLCGQVGALAATYCLEQAGPQNHRYTRAEFLTRFRKHFDDGELLNELF